MRLDRAALFNSVIDKDKSVRVDIIDHKINISVIIQIGKGNAVAFLEVADAGGGGDVEETFAVYILEQFVGYGGPQLRIAGAEVEIKIAVVIDVAEICAHSEGDAIQCFHNRNFVTFDVDPATHHIPVVMVTALDQPSDKVRGLEAGADDFLTKPVDDVLLMARVPALEKA